MTGENEDGDGDEDDDPFERLDDAEDREGDPFAHIHPGGTPDRDASRADEGETPEADEAVDWLAETATEPDASRETETGREADASRASDPGRERDDTAETGQTEEMPSERGIESGITQSEPGDVDAEAGLFERPDDREGDPFGDIERVFERMDADAVETDAVWADLDSLQEQGSAAERDRRTYAEISKHSFCEQCEHFSGPPEVRCTHDGTEILEFPDMETVRVVDCPVVAERRRLEDQE